MMYALERSGFAQSFVSLCDLARSVVRAKVVQVLLLPVRSEIDLVALKMRRERAVNLFSGICVPGTGLDLRLLALSLE